MNQSVTKHGDKKKSTTNFSCHKTNMFFIALSLNYTTKETKAHAVNIQNNRVNMQRTSAASTHRQQAHSGSRHTTAASTQRHRTQRKTACTSREGLERSQEAARYRKGVRGEEGPASGFQICRRGEA